MSRIVSTVLYLLFAISVFAQTKEELINRAIFNRIEFFINTQMTDSIYSLASEKFKDAVTKPQFELALHNLYQLGKIKNVETLDFRGKTGIYLLEFPSNFIEAHLMLDSTYHFDALLFKPSEKSTQKIADKEEVISQAEKTSPVDFFIDSVANTYVKKGNAQSLAIGIFHNNAYKTYFYGETEKGNGILPTEDTLYEIGSITKVLTATLLADLVTKNIIQLDDSISKFLPDSVASNPDIQKITFKSLANHTSGLPRLPDNIETTPGFNPNDPYADYDIAALYTYLKAYKATKEVGESYAYSNLGYGLLGQIIANITKKPFMQSLQETVLSPLQMINTTDKPDPKKHHMVKVYNDKGEETIAWNFQSLLAAGGIKSTVKDLMLFAVEQFKMPLNDLQNAMGLTRQFTFFTPDNTDIGLAWHMNLVDEGIYFWHNGGTGGSRSFIGISPDTKTAIVVLSNSAINVDQISVTMLEKLLSTAQ